MKQKDLIFICRKCEHNLYVSPEIGSIKRLLKKDCPNCGEEREELWILSREGHWKGEVK